MPLLANKGSTAMVNLLEERDLGDRPCSPRGDRSTSAKTYWLYIPLLPEQRQTA